MEEGGGEEVFYIWDLKSNSPKKAPGNKGSKEKNIALNGLDPALEGSWEIELATGQKVKVSTVFEALKEILSKYTPEAASKITQGPGPDTIRKFARDFAPEGYACNVYE